MLVEEKSTRTQHVPLSANTYRFQRIDHTLLFPSKHKRTHRKLRRKRRQEHRNVLRRPTRNDVAHVVGLRREEQVTQEEQPILGGARVQRNRVRSEVGLDTRRGEGVGGGARLRAWRESSGSGLGVASAAEWGESYRRGAPLRATR